MDCTYEGLDIPQDEQLDEIIEFVIGVPFFLSSRSTTLRTSEGNMDDRKSCQHSKDPKLPGLMELESRLEEDKMRNDATDAGRTSHGALAVSFSDGMVEENAFIMDAPLLFEDESPTSGIVEPQENGEK